MTCSLEPLVYFLLSEFEKNRDLPVFQDHKNTKNAGGSPARPPPILKQRKQNNYYIVILQYDLF